MAGSVILGAGFGGIAVATELRRRLGDDHETVLIDADEECSMGLRKLWALVGMGTIAQGSRSRRRLAGGGIEFVHARVEEIDPAARTVRADGRAWQADFLVVALGAQPRPDLVPGLTEHAHGASRRAGMPSTSAGSRPSGSPGGSAASCRTRAGCSCPRQRDELRLGGRRRRRRRDEPDIRPL